MTRHPPSLGRTPTASDVPGLSPEQVWRAVSRASFAILGHVTPAGEPRSSGVVYAAVGRHLYVVTNAHSWKARQIADGDPVGVTVPIRRGGLLSLVAPIPPATVSFRATAVVHPPGTVDVRSVSKRLASQLPDHGRGGMLLELVPHGTFLTYGLGVSLRGMLDPVAAQAHVPVQ